jgi:5-methyltetrahydropteroyltriglutamate--homocysteine methyltransferase
MYGYDFLAGALKYAHVPVKQAVISPSALSLMYPAENLPGYSREEFVKDLLGEHEKEIRGCIAKGAHKVQIDFTEGRLAVKIDPGRYSTALSSLTISRSVASPKTNVGNLPGVGIGIRPTAGRWITQRFCRACWNSRRGTFISRLLGNRIARACCG